jgi:hypothetical protein
MVAVPGEYRQEAAMPSGHQGGGAPLGGGPERSYSVAAAAQALAIPERTLRDWVRAGKVVALDPAPSQRGTRIPESAVQELRRTLMADASGAGTLWAGQREPATSGGEPREAASSDGDLRQVAAEESEADEESRATGGEPQRLSAENSETDGVGEPPIEALHARLEGAQLAAKLHAQRYRETRTQANDERDRLLQLVERERTESREALERAQADIEFLREQLGARTDAERELRLLLARTTQTMELMAEKPALVASTQSTKQRVRWWMPWRRR